MEIFIKYLWRNTLCFPRARFLSLPTTSVRKQSLQMMMEGRGPFKCVPLLLVLQTCAFTSSEHAVFRSFGIRSKREVLCQNQWEERTATKGICEIGCSSHYYDWKLAQKAAKELPCMRYFPTWLINAIAQNKGIHPRNFQTHYYFVVSIWSIVSLLSTHSCYLFRLLERLKYRRIHCGNQLVKPEKEQEHTEGVAMGMCTCSRQILVGNSITF